MPLPNVRDYWPACPPCFFNRMLPTLSPLATHMRLMLSCFTILLVLLVNSFFSYIPYKNFRTLRDPESPTFQLIEEQLKDCNLQYFLEQAETYKTGYIFGNFL